MFKRIVLIIILWLVLLPGPANNAQSSELQLPAFVPGLCPVDFVGNYEIECGMVVVPQDRSNPEERTIQIATAVFKARSESPEPDPLIFLDGGPGSRTLDSYAGGLGNFLGQINSQRDVILFDYRGTGHSDPALTCPETIDSSDDNWVTVCRDRFEVQGVDVTDFTTTDNASDAADIVHALGYETYNVWGGSYGSSVALTLLRDHSENIRAAIVTAMQPPQADLESAIPVYFQRSLNRVSVLCQANDACSAAFPGDLTPKLAAIVEGLNEDPLPVTMFGVETVITGNDIIGGFGQLMKDENNIPIIPGFIEALYAGQYDDVEYYANALNMPPDPENPIGAYLSMRCTDSILAVTPETYEAAPQTINPAFREAFSQTHLRNVAQCQAWGARVPTDTDRIPATTNTPVLIISGDLDPYSSQEWLESTLESLPNGQGFMLPYHMHYVIQHPCASELLVSFIADPNAELDSSCTARVSPPVFKVP